MKYCPQCLVVGNIVKNGHTINKKQNYLCKICKKQFVDNKYLKYKRHNTCRNDTIIRFLQRGRGIRDIEFGLGVSRARILKILAKFNYVITPKLKRYKSVQVDELWSFVGNKN